MTTLPGMSLPVLLAQAGGGATGGLSSVGPIAIQFALIIGIIYFIMIRPQQRQRKKHEELLGALKRGDEIVTAGGIVGEVIHIREVGTEAGKTRADDRVTIKSGESRLVVERGRIARINGAAASSAANAKLATPAE
jgi:preprotein translocase subunit YajC